MTYEEMKTGFLEGRRLVQERHSSSPLPEELVSDELIRLGFARTDGWFYCRSADCEVRLLIGIKAEVIDNEHPH